MITILLAAALQSAVPPPLPQRVADCERPVYASDQLVCEDPKLRALDSAMRPLLRSDLPEGGWLEGQNEWFRRSRMCAFKTDHAACLTDAYGERLTVLRLATEQIRSEAFGLKCAQGVSAARTEDALILRDAQGGTVGVAVTAPRSSWRPWLTTRQENGRWIIRNNAQQKIAHCRGS